jgi:hypothetical protein
MMALQALGSGATAIGQNANKITQTVQGLSDEEYAIQSAKNPYGKSNTDSIGSQMSGIGSLFSLDIGGAVNHYSDVFAQSKDRKKMIDESSSLSDIEKKKLKFNNTFGSLTQMMGASGLLAKVGMDSAFRSTQDKLEKELATNYNKEQIAHGDKLMGINRNAINIKALGGKLSNALSVNSLNPDIALTEVNAGSTHEGSPINGVPMGINQTNGQPNMVEQGETVVNNYVLSDRLKIDGKLFNGKFKNNTIADASKTLYKEIKERPNDPISKNTWNTNVGKLILFNEINKEVIKLNTDICFQKNENSNEYIFNDKFDYYHLNDIYSFCLKGSVNLNIGHLLITNETLNEEIEINQKVNGNLKIIGYEVDVYRIRN